ncbi:hypothetical protein C2W62_36055 [Candidatus Entotheonella serta]|nr:hypothetical protein C2W62_36055 [Candidatus Entotheonella serta]
MIRKKAAQANSGLVGLFKNPAAYDIFGKIVGRPAPYQWFVTEVLNVQDGQSVLDLGCGTAAWLAFLPETVSYVGIDVRR